MKLQIEHVALSVSDMQRSLDFYCGILGFEVMRTINSDSGSDLGTITRMPNCRAQIVHLKSGDFMLELFEYAEPRGKPIPESRRQADHGLNHIGLHSTDVQRDYRELKERGIHFLSAPVEFRPGVWVVYFNGPDGEVCELRCT
jgi:catechol 2,3-dioxygenase-like lactoylglutathione lyase family enzyme